MKVLSAFAAPGKAIIRNSYYRGTQPFETSEQDGRE
jgi:hypothetical protein